MNTKNTSSHIAHLAGETLADPDSSQTAKRLAASALSQAQPGHQTGAEMEEVAARVLQSDKYAQETKQLAATVLSQSVKER